ncbi:MAG: benzoate-CoA ligase family protein [Chloroflexales bacterium]|nr:benzoate-CoA ligase family protein [Chloroflexales bacterium]
MNSTDLPVYYNVVDILEHNLAARADKVALYSVERTMTFREVQDEVNQVGNALKSLGIRFGETVAILAPDSAEWVTTFFGVMKIGAIALGLNTLLKAHEYAYMLRDSCARAIVVHAALLPAITAIRDQAPDLDHVIVLGAHNHPEYLCFETWIGEHSTELAATPTHRDDFCALNYSSGTTGEPKGILHAHKDYPIIAQLWGRQVLGLREDDRTFAVAKLFFTFGTGGNLMFPWSVGASCVLFSGSPRDPLQVLTMIQRFKPTILYNAPTGYAAALTQDSFADYDLSSLRLCVSAGEALPAPIWHAWKERTGLDIIDGIGSTEVIHIFISNRPDDIRPGSSGKPVPGFAVRLIDEQGSDVPPGEIGNLLVKGPCTALSYLHQYEKSRQTFRGEWLFTGDKYFADADGYYWHAGRSDDMLKVGGIWVSPMEVESMLIRHPAVLECAVIGRPDQSDLIKPYAFVALKSGHAPSAALEQELIAYCREHMAEFKRPRWVTFVEELPKTATGKIQRFKLRALSQIEA